MGDLVTRAAGPGVQVLDGMRVDEERGPAALEDRGAGYELVGTVGCEDVEEGGDALGEEGGLEVVMWRWRGYREGVLLAF